MRQRVGGIMGPEKQAEVVAQFDVLIDIARRTEATVNALRTDVAVLKTDVAELKTDVAELKTDVAELKVGQAELKADVAELKTDVAELKTDVAELKVGQAELKADMERLRQVTSNNHLTLKGRVEQLGDMFTHHLVDDHQRSSTPAPVPTDKRKRA